MKYLSKMQADYGLQKWEVVACATAGIAAFAAGLWLIHPAAAIMAGYMVFSVLMIVLIDSRNFIIPDFFSLPAVPLGLAVVAVISDGNLWALVEHAAAAAAAAAVLYLIAQFYRMSRGFDGLGLGDVKLAAAAGAWTGLDGLPGVLLLATGAALAAVLLRNLVIGTDRATLTTAVPFGSFLAPAILVVWGLQTFGYY